MEILDIVILKGPNYWSIHHKIAEVLLNIEEYERLPTNRINRFYELLVQLLPGLQDHQCLAGKPGGFLKSVKEGTLVSHVVEHVANELQSIAGMKMSFGKTVPFEREGVYKVIFAYQEERAAIYAARSSLRLVESICKGQNYDVNADIAALRKIASEDCLRTGTSAIIQSALARDIPVLRLDSGSLVQLGYGSVQKRIEATYTDCTSTISVRLASDKHKTKMVLREAGIVVPEGFLITDSSELIPAIRELGFPVVIKPNHASQGRGVTAKITRLEEALPGFQKAKIYNDQILVEKFHEGSDYRLLVINYKFVAAARITPAMVTGDGKSKLRQLIEIANLDPARGEDHENIMTKIKLDSFTEEFLRFQDITMDDTPPMDKTVYLRDTANLSTGGTAEDVTDLIHPQIISMAERVARIIGLDVCGIDFISEDICLPMDRSKGVVIEVNPSPGFRMHTHPLKGKPRKVGDAVVEMLFPQKNNGRIPLIAVTGTNGKTTTTRLIAHLAASAGFQVGIGTSDGIYFGNELIEEGDCTGHASELKILRDKSINFAVLECGSSGILHSGLAFDQCDIGIVLNLEEDHPEFKGIHSLEEMARVISVVPATIKSDGVAILNADKPLILEMKNHLKCKVALFSSKLSLCVLEHCQKGGIAAIYKESQLLLIKGNTIFLNESISDIPLAFGGKALFMVENILAAVLAAYCRGIDVETISRALHSLVPSFDNLPGKMNLFHFKNLRLMLDNAHNPHGIASLGSWIKKEGYSSTIGVITAAGNMREADIVNFGKVSADIFNKIIIRLSKNTGVRSEREIIELIFSGIRKVNKNLPVEVMNNEEDALDYTLLHADSGSLIVFLSDNIKKSFELIKKYKQKEKELIDENEYRD